MTQKWRKKSHWDRKSGNFQGESWHHRTLSSHLTFLYRMSHCSTLKINSSVSNVTLTFCRICKPSHIWGFCGAIVAFGHLNIHDDRLNKLDSRLRSSAWILQNTIMFYAYGRCLDTAVSDEKTCNGQVVGMMSSKTLIWYVPDEQVKLITHLGIACHDTALCQVSLKWSNVIDATLSWAFLGWAMRPLHFCISAIL